MSCEAICPVPLLSFAYLNCKNYTINKKTRQLPTLPPGYPGSTIGTKGLNFRVRNGNGCFPFVMVAGIIFPCVLKFSGDISQGRPWGHPQKGHARKDVPFGNVPGSALGGAPYTDIAFFCLDKLYGQVSRAISTGKLNPLPDLHTQPIKHVVSMCPSALAGGRSNLGECFPLICFQRLSLPNIATQRCSWRNNWHTRGSSIPVLSY